MTPPPQSDTDGALLVLGCRVRQGHPSDALLRRLRAARETWEKWNSLSISKPAVIMSGGRKWDGQCETDAMIDWWKQQGESSASLIREPDSQTTRGNAHYSAKLCRDLGVHHVYLITCDFHMARALKLVRETGLGVTPVAAPSPFNSVTRARMNLREFGARLLQFWEKTPK